MSAPVNPEAVRTGDLVTGRNGIGGVFDVRVEAVHESAEGPRFRGRIELPSNRDWHGYPWSFGPADLVDHQPKGARR